jgi:diguanylate cyclase (GGDEF)-like protein
VPVADPRTAFRLAQAKQEAPRALLWTGLLILALSVLQVVIEGRGIRTGFWLHAGSVAVFLACAWLTFRPGFPPALTPWAIVVSAYSMIAALQLEVVLDPTALGMAYVLLAMLAYGPFTLSGVAMAVSAVPVSLGFVAAAWAWDPDQVGPWLVAGVAALALGAVLLRVRIRSIDELGDLTEAQRALATRDPLTGILNRRGVEERVGDLMAIARRHGTPVSVTFVDVDGLKSANDSYGHDFGDEVIVAVARALRALLRESDIVGRWGGDEFIVVGLGEAVSSSVLEERLLQRFTADGLDLSRWPGQVSIGSATSSSTEDGFADLVLDADVEMYRRRGERRA